MKDYKSFVMLSALWVLSACGDTASSSIDESFSQKSPTESIEAPIKDARDNRIYYSTQIGTHLDEIIHETKLRLDAG